MKNFQTFWTLLFGIAAVCAPLFAGAQTLESLGGGSNVILNVTVTPPTPGPRQQVSVSVQSYATDLDRSDIAWFLNSKLAAEGTGQKTFSFKTGAAGSLSNILIVAKLPDGSTVQQSLDIRPAFLDLVWEAVSYTPPFYRGKALFPYEGTVKVVAMPDILTDNGGRLNPKNLVYAWSIDGNPVPDVSGFGKNFIFFNGALPFKTVSLSVTATTVDKLYSASGATTLTPQLPYILFYEDSPLYGVLYGNALGSNVPLANPEIRVAAVPYFIGAANRQDSALAYKWQLNNQPIAPGASKDGVTFRQNAGTSGVAQIGLDVSILNKVFQTASGGLSISFGATNQGGQF